MGRGRRIRMACSAAVEIYDRADRVRPGPDWPTAEYRESIREDIGRFRDNGFDPDDDNGRLVTAIVAYLDAIDRGIQVHQIILSSRLPDRATGLELRINEDSIDIPGTLEERDELTWPVTGNFSIPVENSLRLELSLDHEDNRWPIDYRGGRSWRGELRGSSDAAPLAEEPGIDGRRQIPISMRLGETRVIGTVDVYIAAPFPPFPNVPRPNCDAGQ